MICKANSIEVFKLKLMIFVQCSYAYILHAYSKEILIQLLCTLCCCVPSWFDLLSEGRSLEWLVGISCGPGLESLSIRILQIQLAEDLEWFIKLGQSNLYVYWNFPESRPWACGPQKCNHANLNQSVSRSDVIKSKQQAISF